MTKAATATPQKGIFKVFMFLLWFKFFQRLKAILCNLIAQSGPMVGGDGLS
jgi:hypothetical protein